MVMRGRKRGREVIGVMGEFLVEFLRVLYEVKGRCEEEWGSKGFGDVRVGWRLEWFEMIV